MTRPSARVYEELRRRILTGEYASGAWLREENIATALDVSRTPVRDALRRLQADGLVEAHPNRGTQVTGMGSAGLDDIFEIRALLESHAARRAAEREGSEAFVEEMRALCDAMDEVAAADGDDADDRITALNVEFHRTLHRAAGNALLPGLISGVIEISLVRHTFHNYSSEEMRRSLRQHRELVDAMDARDGLWAQSVMASHVLAARASLRRHLTEQQPQE
ncbi:GntR family transcriptional regulator [Streptomyces sp. NPDC001443]